MQKVDLCFLSTLAMKLDIVYENKTTFNIWTNHFTPNFSLEHFQ